MKVKSESEVAQSCPTQGPHGLKPVKAPPSMGFSRKEYWSGVPLPSYSCSKSVMKESRNLIFIEQLLCVKSYRMVPLGSEEVKKVFTAESLH